jgi:uncharacterized protein YcfJ
MKIQFALGIAALLVSVPSLAQVTFYEGNGFRGRAFTTGKSLSNFRRGGFNDRASSVDVRQGSWQVCEEAAFKGNCVVLRQGSYESLERMGMQRRISSMRPASAAQRRLSESPEPLARADYAYRRRPEERTFTVAVSSVRAVVGPPTQHCWVEREQVTRPRAEANVGGAIVGAILGGVLGHQVGGGSGKDIATAGGAVVGAAIGSRTGRDDESGGRDIRRCEQTPSGPPDYWDVSYNFRGQQHHVQMSAPPGPTLVVNEEGIPRQ